MHEKTQFYRKLFSLVLPLALQNLMSAIVSASDAVMLGFLNQDSLSAVSLATQVQFVLNLFFVALTIGTTILAAQYWGKGDIAAVEKTLGIATRFSLLISFVFFTAALGCPSLLMRIFTNEAALIALGIPYLRIVSFSYLLMGFSQIYLCIMKNSGRTLRSTVYSSAAMLLNLLLNAMLIFGFAGIPALGIEGAAYATLIARLVEAVLVLLENGGNVAVRIRLSYLIKADKILQRDFIKYTTPMLLNELAWGCGFTMFSVIMGHLGNDAVAANSVANIVKNIIACVCLGIGTGSGIMVGNELGSGHMERAKRCGDRLSRLSILAGAVTGGIILLCIPLIMRMTFTLSETAAGYLNIMLLVCSYYIIGKSINCTVIAGIFPAGSDTRFGLICDTVTMWCIVVPAGLIAAFVLKLPVIGVYLVLNTDEIIKLPVVYWYYKKYKWLKNITRESISQ
ncbi:MAG: MATE family efflux transporter [Clostridia bacterium]|nr:MATE family efflux transporter [Clostridia bacterium]